MLLPSCTKLDLHHRDAPGGGTVASLSRFLGKMFAGAARRSVWQRYSLAVSLPILALALTATFSELSVAPFFTVFSFAVVLAAMFGGVRPGLVAVATSVILNLLSLPPVFSFRVSDPEHVVRVIAFAAVASFIAVLIGSAGELQNRLDVERRRLEVTLRSIGDAVIATDRSGRVTFMNSVAETATGYAQQEAQGLPLQKIFNIVNETSRKPVDNPVDKVLTTGRIVGLANHAVLIRKNGTEIPIDDSAAPIVNQGVMTGVILVFRDITEAKQSEAALLHAEKLASVGRLAATIAHEINNPLEAVTNLLFLITSSEKPAEMKAYAEAAQVEVARASHVSRQTLSFSRATGTRAPASLPELVDSVITLYDSRLKSKEITLQRRYRGDGVAFASSSEVRQVVSNLLGNAIDAERQGGRIDIRISSSPDKEFIRLTVADRGTGMTPEQKRRIFEAFYTTKQDVGTGLGLWATKQIVDSHDGKIRLRSRVGFGSVFTVSWPVREAKFEQAAAALD